MKTRVSHEARQDREQDTGGNGGYEAPIVSRRSDRALSPFRRLIALAIGGERLSRAVAAGVIAVFAASPACCQKDDRAGAHTAVEEIEWTGIKGFREWGQTSDGLFGVSTEYELETWKWNGPVVKKDVVARVPDVLRFVALRDGVYLACKPPGEPLARWPLVLETAGSKEPMRKWDPPAGWGYSHTGPSRNGRFAGFILKEDEEHSRDWENPDHRVGLVDLSSKELRLVSELKGDGLLTVRQMSVSDDGRYIAIGGWNNGVALVDASLHKVLWAELHPDIVSIGYVMFSPDGSTLYEADAGGGFVNAVQTKSGKVARRWCATETGEAVYGQRISCLAVSADGHWLAAGTGPAGQVFLFSTRSSDSKPIVLPHGLSTILVVSFSPDSKYLASLAGGKIKIWDVGRLREAAGSTRAGSDETTPGRSDSAPASSPAGATATSPSG